MAATFAWRRALAAVSAAAALLSCKDAVTAPGACPALCPSAEVELVDTLLLDVDTSDATMRGYFTPLDASVLFVSDLDSLKSVTLARFSPREDGWFQTTADTVLTPIGAIDSVVLELQLGQRDTLVRDLRLLIYRVPLPVDSTGSYASLSALLADTMLVDSILVDSILGDSITSGLLTKLLPTGAVLPAPQDSGVVALAFGLRAAQQTIVTLASSEVIGGAARMRWYVHGPTAADTLRHTFNETATLDFFAADPVPATIPGSLAVGNLPSARSLLRLALPPFLLDSTTVARGTLVLTPLRPATGRLADPFVVEARPLIRDFGPKSATFTDTSVVGRATVTPGDTTPIQLDIGGMLRLWASEAGDSLPRALLLLTVPESGTIGEIVVGDRASGPSAPALRVTYIRPYQFGVP
jgi:hypothetical protein